MANAFFDLHFHPVFKSYISRHEDQFPSKRPASELVKSFKLNSKLANKIDDVILHMLQSQCSVDQCTKGQVRVGVASIANLEFGFADSRGFVSDIIQSNFTAPMDKKYFDKVKSGEVSYYRLLIKELDLYRVLAKSNTGVKFLNRKAKKNIDGEKGMHLVFSLEGGHNLCRMKVAQTLQIDDDVKDWEQNDSFTKEFTTNAGIGVNPAESIRKLHAVLWENDMDLLYLTLTHLCHISEQFLATHAFGMKMLKHASFYPSGNGISAMGRDVIDACYGMKQGNEATPILIDVKHMGLKSRQDLYQLRKEKGYTLPLLASHVGVTGYTIKEWKDSLKRQKCKVYNYEGVRSVEVQMERKRCGEWGSSINNEFSFNPWSINMMDDDIIEVLNSDGLIGVSLDVRLLGFQAKIGLNTADQSEYVSTSDFQTHFPYIGLLTLPGDKLESMAVDAESWLVPTKEERHPLCLCFNIIHIIAVGKLRTNKDPWKQICIGSDFDGMIEPLKTCSDASSLQELEYNLLKWLPVAAKAYEKENGGMQIFPTGFMQDATKLRELVNGILFENGKRFMQDWVNGKFK